MTVDDLEKLKARFAAYADVFINTTADPGPHILKRDHTLRVCQEIVSLGQSLSLPPDDICMAEVAALLHDIGRFEQLKQYGTFVDRDSINHAHLGLQVIREEGMLADIEPEERHLIEEAVACHNVARIPDGHTGRGLQLIKMLRDADKLDIWGVAIRNYQVPKEDADAFVNLDLEDTAGFSPNVLAAVHDHRPVNSDDIKNLNDLKLMQISWVFDLNFDASLAQVNQRGIVPAIIATMAASDTVQAVSEDVQAYLQRR